MENFRDAELKKWLAEEYEKETEEMERILFPDGVIPDDGETEEEAKAAYQRLVEKLKADGVYKEDETDSIKTDDHKENVKIVYLPEKKSHKAARVAAAVLVCSAGIFAASMTSQANRSYFIDSVRYWVGDDTSISIENDEGNEKAQKDEQMAIDNVEKELGVNVPLILERPKGFKFKDYRVNAESGYAFFEYSYNGEILTIYINKYDKETKSSGASLDGKEIDTIKLPEEEISIQIKKIMAKGDKKASYVAYWSSSTEFYQIESQMEEQKFKVIIVEDVKLELKGTEEIFRHEIPNAEVIGTAMTESEFWPLMEAQLPDLVLLDLGLGGSTTIGVDICKNIFKRYKGVRVLIFTGEILNEKLWVDVLNAGADGIILKTGELLTKTDVQAVMDGKKLVFNYPILEKIVDRFKKSVANDAKRQEAVISYDIDEYDERFLRHLALGYTKEMIANLKGMPFGVKSLEKRQNDLIGRLFPNGERVGVNATRLAVRALELRIIDLDNLEPAEE